MPSFYIKSCDRKEELIVIRDEAKLRHIRDALRMKKGEKISVFDEKGNEYNCVVEDISSSAILRIKNIKKHEESGKPKITIACALPKRSKFDDIVDKLTQLGVHRIIPLETERVVVKLDKSKKFLRHKRWEKIAQEASEQSQRKNVTLIEPVKGLNEVLAESKEFDLKLIPTLSGERDPLKEIISQGKHKHILIFIGPEGDFSEKEVALAMAAGCIPVSLGETVLRVETAAVAVASFIKLYEDN